MKYLETNYQKQKTKTNSYIKKFEENNRKYSKRIEIFRGVTFDVNSWRRLDKRSLAPFSPISRLNGQPLGDFPPRFSRAQYA